MKTIFKKILILVFLNTTILPGYSKKTTDQEYESYSSSDRARSGIALGGLGTGSIELRKDGNFYNWSIFNNYPLGTGPVFKLPVLPGKNVEDSYLFFLVRYQVEGQKPKIKLLQLNQSLQEGGLDGIIYFYPWMSGIDKIKYSARFPFVDMIFTDSEMPFEVSLEAFSPFIPHDINNSSLPGIFFNFKIKSLTDKKVDIMLLGSLRNLVAYDQLNKAFESELIDNNKYKFFIHKVSGVSSSLSSFGQMGLGAIGGDEVSYYLGWEHKHPYYEKLLIENKLDNIDDTPNRNMKTMDGKIVGRFGDTDNDQRCFSSIAISHKLNHHKDEFASTFFLNWYFPNSYGAINNTNGRLMEDREKSDYSINLKQTKLIGHYYQFSYSDINNLVNYFVNSSSNLSNRTHQFVNDMYSSDLDNFVLNQVNSQLNTFITSSVLTKDKVFSIREGLTPYQSWGPNATMDVSLYGSPMIIALFPELQMSMMRAHARLQRIDGEINHGLGYDPDFNQNGTWGVFDRVDLVPDFIQIVLRDYLWTNNKQYMKEMWPNIKKGINYILTKKDLNGDQMPDMNGIMCSYDNFPMYGLASYIQSQWIVALNMASLAAKDMDDIDLSIKYKEIATKGAKLMEQKLWNGTYYNLWNDYTGTKGTDNGCLTDQLIGQWVADCCGLGYLFDSIHVHKSLKTIMKKSFVENSFLRNCSWPAYQDLYPIHTSNLWVDQANTPWTGVELGFASFLIYEDQIEDGLKLIKAVDDRYRKSGLYFDHQEFGGHYYRPMSAWAIMNSVLGFSINRGCIKFSPHIKKQKFQMFFVTPDGTAIYKKIGNSIKIIVKSGKLNFSEVVLDNIFNKKRIDFLVDGKVISCKIKHFGNNLKIEFEQPVLIDSGSTITIL